MTDNDYNSILTKALDEWIELESKRQNIEVELANKLQFIRATFNLLSDEDKPKFDDRVRSLSMQPEGITLAVRRVLQDSPSQWYTATLMRDKLNENGFDFSNYRANPLASIHAVLKRSKPEEIETENFDGVMAWRWKAGAPKRYPRLFGARRAAFIGKHGTIVNIPRKNIQGLGGWPDKND